MSGFVLDSQGWFITVAPGEDRDYSLDWTDFLASLGSVPVDILIRSAWTLPAGVTAGPASFNPATNITTQWIASPTIGEYFILNTVTTVNGRIFPRGFRLIVAENI